MNILNHFTIRNLKLNRKRTLVTIIGILLSTALICAVAGVACSFQESLIKHAIDRDGNYHALFYDVPSNKQKYITQNVNVESYFSVENIGYAKVDSKNEYKPYVHLMGFDQNALKNYGLNLLEGRMPENDNEILITEHLQSNGEVNWKVGDTVSLDISTRLIDGKEIPNQKEMYSEDKNETLEKEFTKEYKIVGKIDRTNHEIEEFSAPGYTIITLKELPSTTNKITSCDNNIDILVKYKNIKETYNLTKEIAKTADFSEGQTHVNSELLRWSGVLRDNNTLGMLYSLAGIVIAIIIVSSVFVIRNSFQISITEKIKQYGVLSSIGATKKQIKNNVLFEGFILGTISIPLGILSGCLATFILTKITTYLLNTAYLTSNTFEIVYNVPILAILLSILLSMITIFLSSISSARRASKISPIEAIRSSNDIKIKSRKLRTPKIITKIFGIGGEIAYKNLKRNKQKYRTTVISLVVSVSIFISLSSFIYYIFEMSGMYYKDLEYNVELYGAKLDNIQEIEKLENLEKMTVTYSTECTADIEKFITKEGKDYFENLYEDEEELKADISSINLLAVNKNIYQEYLKRLNINENDISKNEIIYIGDGKINTYDSEGKLKKLQAFNFKEGDEVPVDFIKYDKKGNITEEQKENIKIIKITDEKPYGLSQFYVGKGIFLINLDDLKGKDYYVNRILIQSTNAEQFCKDAESIAEKEISCINLEKEQESMHKMVLLISIFLYGFITVISLIGVTNIFNTITTNMNLRSKEFANLKSIGMTKKEFNRMINLETIFYGVKSLIYGIIIGTGISYWIYHTITSSESMVVKYVLPVKAILISIVFVMFIVGLIMRFSLNKINKQNIIETIRNENI